MWWHILTACLHIIPYQIVNERLPLLICQCGNRVNDALFELNSNDRRF